MMDGNIAKIVGGYALTQNKIKHLKEQREVLEREIKYQEEKSGWIDCLIKPIGGLMREDERLKNTHMEILGPFGLGTHTSIWFTRPARPDEDENKTRIERIVASITFQPGDLDKGELMIVNEKVNTHQFAPGTIGEVNGMNHPLYPMFGSVRELVNFALKEA